MVAAALLAGCSGGGTVAEDPAPPVRRANVLLVTLDTTRADALGAYGADRGMTPRLDALADGATVFELAIAQAAVTPVSHASILTGLEPFHHGLRVLHGVEENRLPDDRETLAEILRDAGWSTGAFLSAFPVTERFGLDQGFQTFDSDFITEPGAAVGRGGTVSTGRVQRRGDETTDRVLDWLDGRQEPFFAWVHYFDPHDPLVLPPREFVDSFGPMPQDELDVFRELYAREVAFMDRQVGRVLDALAADGRLDDTLVVVISDHGEGLGDHDWWTHGILYQEQIRVPWILFDPSRPPGRIGAMVRSTDLVPTLLDLLGLPPRQLDGRSLVPLMDFPATSGPGRPPEWIDAPAYADSINVLTYNPHPLIRDVKDDVLFVVIEPPWKYIHHLRSPERSELYHLDDDPGETANLLASSPDVVAALRRRLGALDALPESFGSPTAMSEEDRRRLEALGYVQ